MEEGPCTVRYGGHFIGKGVLVLQEVEANRAVGKERL